MAKLKKGNQAPKEGDRIIEPTKERVSQLCEINIFFYLNITYRLPTALLSSLLHYNGKHAVTL